MLPLPQDWTPGPRLPTVLPTSCPANSQHRRPRRVGKRISPVGPQAPSELPKRCPVPRHLPTESPAVDENQTTPAETTLSISSATNDFSSRPLMILKGTLNHAPVSILIDSGSMGNFVSQQAVARFSFALHDISPVPIHFANGTFDESNKTLVAAYLKFPSHEENLNLRVVSLPHHDIILGKPWLEKWNPAINWRTHEIYFPESPQATPPKVPTKTPKTSQEPRTPMASPIVINTISLAELESLAPHDDNEMFLAELSPSGDLLVNDKDPRIAPLLAEFDDVFPDELPLGLPPTRDIDHRITLEPRHTPPW